MKVQVQTADFDSGAVLDALTGDGSTGAVASFIGIVRNHGDRQGVTGIELEHYPGMTEKALRELAAAARDRFGLIDGIIIHRVGRLALGDRIVMVATAAPHRAAALEACGFLIDALKTSAPFWKREITADGASAWVAAKETDEEATARWG